MIHAVQHQLTSLVVLENDAIELLVKKDQRFMRAVQRETAFGRRVLIEYRCCFKLLAQHSQASVARSPRIFPPGLFCNLYSLITPILIMATTKPISKSSKNAESGLIITSSPPILIELEFYSVDTAWLSGCSIMLKFARDLIVPYGSSCSWDVDSSCAFSLQNRLGRRRNVGACPRYLGFVLGDPQARHDNSIGDGPTGNGCPSVDGTAIRRYASRFVGAASHDDGGEVGRGKDGHPARAACAGAVGQSRS
jgi:hypothetical protein